MSTWENFHRLSFVVKSLTSRASELAVLNDDECKRILTVVERDFKLRQKEYERLEFVELFFL